MVGRRYKNRYNFLLFRADEKLASRFLLLKESTQLCHVFRIQQGHPLRIGQRDREMAQAAVANAATSRDLVLLNFAFLLQLRPRRPS